MTPGDQSTNGWDRFKFTGYRVNRGAIGGVGADMAANALSGCQRKADIAARAALSLPDTPGHNQRSLRRLRPIPAS